MIDPFLSQIITETRAMALNYWKTGFAIDTKPDRTLVTEADRAIEALFRARLAETYPGDGIYGEEHGQARLEAERVWVIDPIDGTQAFVLGVPVFSTLIALVDRGQVVQSVADFPALGQCAVAARGQGARLNGQPLRVSDCHDVANACLTATSPTMFHGCGAGFNDLMDAADSVRFGLDAFGFISLARGRVDLAVEADLKPYDYLAPSLIVEEAGGLMTDWQGAPLSLNSGGRVLAAATPALHAQAHQALGAAG